MLSELFINGTWQKPSTPGTIDVFNPCTEEVLHRVAAGGPADVDKAVAAAKAALPGWKKIGGSARGCFLKAIAAKLRERTEELATLSSRNNGKPLAEARVDMADAAASFEYYAGKAVELEARQNSDVAVPDNSYRSQLRLEPAGVVALIVPWNFPLVTTSWKVAPALAAGCTVVLKPSEITPIVELELGRIVADIGLPPGVVNIITGLGTVGAAMTMHADVAKISFTGSNGVGARVMQAASAGPKSVGLELGGKSPIVVFADADEQLAAELIIGGIFYNAGQMCSATSRLVIEKSVAPRILERVVAMAKNLKHGDSLDPATTMGPLTTRAQYDKVLEYIAKGKALGHRLITGGGKPGGGINRGWFLEPTIFVDVPSSSPLWREEIFGPVLCVQTFEREEEAIDLANDCDFGLVATIVSRDSAKAQRVADAVEAGHVWINSPQTIFVETSWGGFKASGIGRELGPWGLSAYLEVKHKTTRLQA
jgi:betaine-aldehyde dehydrogenase